MTQATAIKLALSKEGKPRDLADVVKLLVQGADESERGESSDSEYLDERWWVDEAEAVDDERHGGNDP